MNRQFRVRRTQEIECFMSCRQDRLGWQFTKHKKTGRKRDTRKTHIRIFFRKQDNCCMLKCMVLLHCTTQHKLLCNLHGWIYRTHTVILPKWLWTIGNTKNNDFIAKINDIIVIQCNWLVNSYIIHKCTVGALQIFQVPTTIGEPETGMAARDSTL